MTQNKIIAIVLGLVLIAGIVIIPAVSNASTGDATAAINKSISKGTNTSVSTSEGTSYGVSKSTSEGVSISISGTNTSEGTSYGISESTSKGVSTGISGTNTSEGTSYGVSKSTSKGVSVTVDGEKVVFPDAKPFIDENGRTLIPVRFVTEDLGATVEWNAEDREVYITKDKSNVLIRIGQEKILVNGITKTMDTKAIIRYDRTYVPIRYVAEGLGATVGWDAGTRTVIITTIKHVN